MIGVVDLEQHSELSVLVRILPSMGDHHPPQRSQNAERSGREPADLAENQAGMGVAFEAARRRQHGTGESRSWEVGARGERHAAEMLARLTTRSRWDRLRGRAPAWRVMHSVPLRSAAGDPRGDIDHVVIGPPGIITINTKHHRNGKVHVDGDLISVNGRRTRYVAAARAEADRTRHMLTTALVAEGHDGLASTLQLRALLLIVGTMPKIQQDPSDVTVVPPQRLLSTLTSLPTCLDAEQIERIHSVARRPATWTLAG